jgi:hypothetical protein
MYATYYNFDSYDTPETEWRYSNRLARLQDKKLELEKELETVKEELKVLRDNPPEKARRDRLNKLLEAEIGG